MMVSSKDLDSSRQQDAKLEAIANERTNDVQSRDELMRPVAASGMQLANVVGCVNENESAAKVASWTSVVGRGDDAPIIPNHEQVG